MHNYVTVSSTVWFRRSSLPDAYHVCDPVRFLLFGQTTSPEVLPETSTYERWGEQGAKKMNVHLIAYVMLGLWGPLLQTCLCYIVFLAITVCLTDRAASVAFRRCDSFSVCVLVSIFITSTYKFLLSQFFLFCCRFC